MFTWAWALAQVHTTIFEDQSTKREARMQSTLHQMLKRFFQVLGFSLEKKPVQMQNVVPEN
jgi:hypothetical protein